MVETPATTTATAVNICEAPDMLINSTYMEMGSQLIILDIGSSVSFVGVTWMTQYLEEFGRSIEELKSTKCLQPFVFGPSRRYTSKTMVELPILITRLDGKEDILVVQTDLVDAEVLFLCGKQTLQN